MKYFYHNGLFGDIIYSLPTVQAMGGGTMVLGLSMDKFKTIAGLISNQDYIEGVLRADDSGLPPEFVDLTLFRHHPKVGRIHIVEAHAQMHKVDLGNWQEGWLRRWPPQNKTPEAILSVTPRYRDRFFNWEPEVACLHSLTNRVVFVGHRSEYEAFIAKYPKSHGLIRYWESINLSTLSWAISEASHFSGNQSAALAIRQGLGLPYRFERSPHHADVVQRSAHETQLNNPWLHKLVKRFI